MSASLLHQRFPELRDSLPRVELCSLPTPVRELGALAGEGESAPAVWVKDDSHSARPWGGNKPRKLEWILADAERRRRGTILTFGGVGTNHGLATAVYSRERGMRCALALVDQPLDPHVEAQMERIRSSGAAVHRTRGAVRTALAVPWLMVRHGQLRPPRPPYWLPPGGSSPLGAVGFVEAGLELAGQVERGELPEPAAILTALGTGGTAAGLLLGLRIAGLRSRVLPVLVSDQLPLSERTVLRLARRSRALLARRGAPVHDVPLQPGDVRVLRGFLGSGYGHGTPEGEAAIEVLAEQGLALEPTYTAKTAAALLAGLRSGELGDGPLLYWHTHSAAAGDDLQPPAATLRLPETEEAQRRWTSA